MSESNVLLPFSISFQRVFREKRHLTRQTRISTVIITFILIIILEFQQKNPHLAHFLGCIIGIVLIQILWLIGLAVLSIAHLSAFRRQYQNAPSEMWLPWFATHHMDDARLYFTDNAIRTAIATMKNYQQRTQKKEGFYV